MEAVWRDGKSASLKGTESRRPTRQDISFGRMLAPSEMKEKMDVGSTKLGINQLFSRWLMWANEDECVYMCVGESIVET